jgi:hypothetical protein
MPGKGRLSWGEVVNESFKFVLIIIFVLSDSIH